MKFIRKYFRQIKRRINKFLAGPKTTLILFDHFGVVGIDPLTKWKQVHQLSPTQIEQVGKICDRIDAGKLEIQPFYVELGKIVGVSGVQTEKEIASYAGYNQELLDIIRQLGKLKHVRIGLLSNAHRSLHQGLWKDGVHPLFDDVLTSQEISKVKPKPDPEFFMHAIHRLGGKPSNTIFFDDRLVNVQGAKAIGLKSHLFTTAAQCKVQLHKYKIFD